MKPIARKIVRNLVWSIVNQLSARGSLTLSAIIVARYFDTNSFAAYGYFNITASLLATFATLGFTTAASKLVAEYVHSGEVEARESLGILWLCALGVALVLSVLLAASPDVLLPDNMELSKWMLAAAVVSYSVQSVPNGVVLGMERFEGAAKNALAGSLVVVLGAAFAVLYRNVDIAIWSVIAGVLLQGFANSLLVLRALGLHVLAIRVRYLQSRILTTLKNVLPLAATSGITMLGMWLVGRVILSGEKGEYDFALYSIGLQWFALAMFMPGNIGTVLLPRFIRARVEGEDSARSLELKVALLASVATAVILALVGYGLSELLVGLYGVAYSSEVRLIPSFLLAAVASSPLILLGNALLAHNLHWHRVWLYAGWISILLLGAVSFSGFGGYAGAIALGTSYAFVVAGMAAIARKYKIL